MKRKKSLLPGMIFLGMVFVLLILSCDEMEIDLTGGDSGSSDGKELLFDAVKEGAKAGTKAVSEEILTSIGKAMVNSYSPAIANLLFGGSSELDEAVKIIVDEIRETGGDLARRMRVSDDTRDDQYASTLEGDFRRASNILSSWLSSEDLYFRIEDLGVLENQWETFEDVRVTIEQYIRREGDVRGQLDRLSLIELHIIAAQLAVTANQYYYSTLAIKVAFLQSPQGSDPNRFQEWVEGLTDEEIRDIEASASQAKTFREIVFNEVLDFYESISGRGYIIDYVDAVFSPVVSHMVQFTGNPNMYDVPDHMNDRNNWNTTSVGFARLDGLRWYYYVNVPNKDCLEGFAFHDLSHTAVMPWTELADDQAGSNCNRFWILDPYMNGSRWPNTFIANMDGYDVWFEEGEKIYDLHKLLERGNILRRIYGPASLVLDRMYEEMNGGTRPKNNWDELFDQFDIQTAFLGVSDSYTSGISYGEVLQASDELRSQGITVESVGLEAWFEALKASVNN